MVVITHMNLGREVVGGRGGFCLLNQVALGSTLKSDPVHIYLYGLCREAHYGSDFRVQECLDLSFFQEDFRDSERE